MNETGRMESPGLETGKYLIDGLREIAAKNDLIGDVRGSGLFIGIDLVRDRDSREPSIGETDRAVNLLRKRGVLIHSTGVHDNILKIRPPLVFSRENADLLLERISDALNEVAIS